MKVKELIELLQQYNENSWVSFHLTREAYLLLSSTLENKEEEGGTVHINFAFPIGERPY